MMTENLWRRVGYGLRVRIPKRESQNFCGPGFKERTLAIFEQKHCKLVSEINGVNKRCQDKRCQVPFSRFLRPRPSRFSSRHIQSKTLDHALHPINRTEWFSLVCRYAQIFNLIILVRLVYPRTIITREINWRICKQGKRCQVPFSRFLRPRPSRFSSRHIQSKTLDHALHPINRTEWFSLVCRYAQIFNLIILVRLVYPRTIITREINWRICKQGLFFRAPIKSAITASPSPCLNLLCKSCSNRITLDVFDYSEQV